jgi:hypothetical protein
MDKETVSIVMTTHKRIKQTIFTLDTIASSSCQNVQVIIVDDSGSDYIDDKDLSGYKFRIDYMKIRPENRVWTNPCVNYNIGFSRVQGQYVIIQNAEVCHVGDVVNFVHKNCTEGKYHVFDVVNTGSYYSNEQLYHIFSNNKFNIIDLNELIKSNGFIWYQHRVFRPKNYHFLTAIHINDLIKINNGFDYDFSLGRWYDDDEFVFRIEHVLKLQIINVDQQNDDILMGIHQHHETVTLSTTKSEYKKSIKVNKEILNKKIKNFNKNGIWVYSCDQNSSGYINSRY